MPVAAVVAAAKAKGIRLSPALVYKVRGGMNGRKAKSAKRGPGRPRTARAMSGSGEIPIPLVVEIEKIVEAKVEALLRARLGALFGG